MIRRIRLSRVRDPTLTSRIRVRLPIPTTPTLARSIRRILQSRVRDPIPIIRTPVLVPTPTIPNPGRGPSLGRIIRITPNLDRGLALNRVRGRRPTLVR